MIFGSYIAGACSGDTLKVKLSLVRYFSGGHFLYFYPIGIQWNPSFEATLTRGQLLWKGH